MLLSVCCYLLNGPGAELSLIPDWLINFACVGMTNYWQWVSCLLTGVRLGYSYKWKSNNFCMSEEQKWLYDVMRWILQTFLSTIVEMKGYPVSRATDCLVSKIGVITVPFLASCIASRNGLTSPWAKYLTLVDPELIHLPHITVIPDELNVDSAVINLTTIH